MTGDEVGHQVLLRLPSPTRGALELLGEPLEVNVGGLLHFLQYPRIDMLRRHLEVPSHVVSGQLVHVCRGAARQIHADATRHQHLADPWYTARLAHQLEEGAMVGAEQHTDLWVHAGEAAADRLQLRL